MFLTALLALTPIVTLDLIFLFLISTGPGIGLVVLSQILLAAYGYWRIRDFDFNLLFFIDAEVAKGEILIKEIWAEAFMIAGAGLLIIPGFLTALLGALILHRQTGELIFDFFYSTSFVKK